MPPQPIINLSELNLTNVLIDKEGIRKINPQRYEMEQLDGIIHIDLQKRIAIGFKDVKENEFWVKGHIPGRPLLPGVLMIEAAAQLASFFTHKLTDLGGRFLGFGGVDQVKFRGSVTPPARLILVCQALEVKPRRSLCYVQGFVNEKMVFEGKITGMPV